MKSAVCLITKAYLPIDIITFVNHYITYCGFNDIIIYDNESSCCNIAELFKNNNNVIVNYLSDEEKMQYNQCQIVIYNQCLAKYKNDYDFIAFFDDDEFLWINKSKYNSINEYLENLYNRNILQFCIPWRYISYKDNEKPQFRKDSMINDMHYINNKNTDFTCVKSIVSTKLNIYECALHLFKNYDNCYYNECNSELKWNVYIDVNYDKCNFILYHYFHRSYDEWSRKLKLPGLDETSKTRYDAIIARNGLSMLDHKNFNYNTYINLF